MAMRSAALASLSLRSVWQGGRRTSSSTMPRYFSDGGGRGRVLNEEERAAENVYIKKMEREKMEKMKHQVEKEKAETPTGTSDRGNYHLRKQHQCSLEKGFSAQEEKEDLAR